MKSAHDIRSSFVDFFVERGHRFVTSAPLVPHGDPSLLFVNAGMVPFKNYFLGLDTPEEPRAVTVQKCLRVSGKHNDLENVGPSPRHHTFFEMLGNFSFGDYFKAEAIRFGWDLVTEVWGLSPEVLTVTVFEEDDQAAALWRKVTSLPESRILKCGAAENFWAMGDTGPCGPCSEIFVDCYPHLPEVDWHVGSESGRYLEIWNLVFMQYEKNSEGEIHDLPNPSIDTGAGLERVAAVLQQVESNYDTDLFQPILRAAAELAGKHYGESEQIDTSFRVIADHLRAVSFLLADGIIPGNEGRGYVLRRILRRAVRHGMRLDFEAPFLYRLQPILAEIMGRNYSELVSTQKESVEMIRAEEEKFFSTVATASRLVQKEIDQIRDAGNTVLSGAAIFKFYDTFGLPLEIVREIAEEERIELDEKGFTEALATQQTRSRAVGGEEKKRLASVANLFRDAESQSKSLFVGYGQLRVEDAKVLQIASSGGLEPALISTLGAGEEGVITFDRTSFYGESGGQIGDRGILEWPTGTAEVSDTQKDTVGNHLHLVRVSRGELVPGQVVNGAVDVQSRLAIQRNHTATHLVHAVLRHVLGSGVRQAGSLVAMERLRFDFTYHKVPTPMELSLIEDLVNRWILAARDVEIDEDRSYQEAVAAGAMALFGEKYGDRVRTVKVPGLILDGGRSPGKLESLELCGGCHVRNTGEIGLLVVRAERGVASGVRRIEAVTGEVARRHLTNAGNFLREISAALGVSPERAGGEVTAWRTRIRELENSLAELRMSKLSDQIDAGSISEIGGVTLQIMEVPATPASQLREMVDVLKGKLGSGIVVLGTRSEGKVGLVVGVTKDLTSRIHAGRLAKKIATEVGGKGGGRSDFAQAGGRDADRLPGALERVPQLVAEEMEDG